MSQWPHVQRTFPNLVLDDSYPWEEVDIGYSTKLKQMRFLAVLVWDIQLSTTATIVYKHSQQVDDPKHSIKLAIYAVYLGGYHCFYYLGSRHLEQLVISLHPALELYCIAKVS
jgi:hypothetical protein